MIKVKYCSLWGVSKATVWLSHTKCLKAKYVESQFLPKNQISSPHSHICKNYLLELDGLKQCWMGIRNNTKLAWRLSIRWFLQFVTVVLKILNAWCYIHNHGCEFFESINICPWNHSFFVETFRKPYSSLRFLK